MVGRERGESDEGWVEQKGGIIYDNVTHPRQSFSKKNELPQVRLKSATLCVLGDTTN